MWLVRPPLNQNLPLKIPGRSSAQYSSRLLLLHRPSPTFQNPPTLQHLLPNLLPTPPPAGSPLRLPWPNGNFPSSESLEPSASFQGPLIAELFPSSGGQKGLGGMTCDLVSFLPSAPPGPGTQQVLRNCPGSCSCKKPTSLSKPGQEEQSWLRAIYFIIPSTRLPHRSDTLAASLSLSEPAHLGGDSSLSQRHEKPG